MKTPAIAIALGVFILGSATVLAHTETETGKDWLNVMREHYTSIHGDDFDQHHQDMHGEDWEEHVNACHGTTEGSEATYQGMGNSMMGYGMM